MASFLGSLWQSVASHSDTDHVTSDAVEKNQGAPIDLEDSQTTPKAKPQTTRLDIPTFQLSESQGEQSDSALLQPAGGPQAAIQSNAVSTKRSAGASQVATGQDAVQSGESPTQSAGVSQDAVQSDASSKQSAGTSQASLRAPPTQRQGTSLQAPRSSMLPPGKSGLMPPPGGRPSGPLPNRGPPMNSQQRVGSNARGKVLLSPGHSPMDWATLTRSNNLSGVPSLQRVTPSQLKIMNGRKGKPIWSSYQGKVYNITPYLPFHPGGEKELFKGAGRDGTKLFMDIHPWVNWEGMLSACLVGILVSEEIEGTLEDID